MTNIPGLMCPGTADVSEESFELQSFSGTFVVPESHRYGHARNINEYEKLSVISEGTFGILYKARNIKTDEIHALKKFRMPTDLQYGGCNFQGLPPAVLREFSILNNLKHENLVNSHATVCGKNLLNNFLVLDYCEYSLKDLFEKNVVDIFNKPMVKFLMKQLFSGLDYIHGGLLIHRDICPQNLLFNGEGILKIGGFHATRFHSKGNMTPGVTELEYRAPELLFQTKIYGPSADMWSAGCIFAQLLLKATLFKGTSELAVLDSIFDILGTPSEAIWPGFDALLNQVRIEGSKLSIQDHQPYSILSTLFVKETSGCKKLIQDLILYCPDARLSAQGCLKSSYFTESQASEKSDLALLLNSINT